MKSIYTILLISAPLFLFSQVIDLNPKFIKITEDSINLNNFSHSFHTAITNVSMDSLNIKWTRVAEDCPIEWDYGISDKYNDYTPDVDSNINPPNWSVPMDMAPDETVEHFGIYLLLNDTPGCCQIKLEISTLENPDDILDILTFDIRINAPDCDITNVSELATENQIQIVPNPASDFIQIIGSQKVDFIEFYNSMGLLVRIFDSNLDNEYFVGDMPKGIYFARLISLNNQQSFIQKLDIQ